MQYFIVCNQYVADAPVNARIWANLTSLTVYCHADGFREPSYSWVSCADEVMYGFKVDELSLFLVQPTRYVLKATSPCCGLATTRWKAVMLNRCSKPVLLDKSCVMISRT